MRKNVKIFHFGDNNFLKMKKNQRLVIDVRRSIKIMISFVIKVDDSSRLVNLSWFNWTSVHRRRGLNELTPVRTDSSTNFMAHLECCVSMT